MFPGKLGRFPAVLVLVPAAVSLFVACDGDSGTGDGTGLINLTNDPALDATPAWSP